ncbi:MAG: TerD family protein, partial [Oscillospiraceae bacterium]|nr:TerD family protein [Oscillospiraceae bacterium]
LAKAEGNLLLLSHPDKLTPEGAEFLETLLNTHSNNLAVILRGTHQETEALFERMPSLRIRFSKYFAFADFQGEDFQVKPSSPKFEIFDVSSLAEQEEQLEALQEAEFPVPEKPLPRKLDASARTGALLKAGARLDLSDYLSEEIRIRLVYQKLKLPMEMDAYVFMLHENELTVSDDDMVFFGNLISKNGGAAIVDGAEYPEAAFVLNRVYQDIEKIAICFSAYGDNPAFDFSQVEKPVLQIFHHDEQIAWMDLQNLKTERTLVAAELYRYQNTWKFRAVASGYRDGLEELCNRFGIEVE